MTQDSHDEAVEAVALLPCPFCGCQAWVHTHGAVFQTPAGEGHRVECEGSCHAMTCYWHTKAEAVENWNRRDPSQSPASPDVRGSVVGGWKRTESLSVAVYWPDEGSYGIPTPCQSMAEAENRAASDWALGYGCGAKSSGLIHIIKTVREVREWKGTP